MLQVKILLLVLGLIPYTSFPHRLQPQFGAGAELGKGEWVVEPPQAAESKRQQN